MMWWLLEIFLIDGFIFSEGLIDHRYTAAIIVFVSTTTIQLYRYLNFNTYCKYNISRMRATINGGRPISHKTRFAFIRQWFIHFYRHFSRTIAHIDQLWYLLRSKTPNACHWSKIYPQIYAFDITVDLRVDVGKLITS